MREKRFRRWRINDWDAGRDRGLQNERGKKRDGGKRGGRMAARARARARHVCVSNSPALQLSVAGTESRESWRLAVLFWASLRACGGPGGGGSLGSGGGAGRKIRTPPVRPQPARSCYSGPHATAFPRKRVARAHSLPTAPCARVTRGQAEGGFQSPDVIVSRRLINLRWLCSTQPQTPTRAPRLD